MQGNILITVGFVTADPEVGSIVLQLSVRQLYEDNYVRKPFKRTIQDGGGGGAN